MLTTSVVDAADWQSVASDAADNRYSIDAQSIVREGSTVTAYVRTDYATPREDAASGSRISAVVDRLVVMCETSAFALESRVRVLADGSETPVVASPSRDLEFRIAAPDSMSETIVRHLCRGPRSAP